MNFSFLTKTLLFRGASKEEVEKMLRCLSTHTKAFQKGEMIYHAGETVDCMGLVLSGSVNIENDDVWGNKSIFSHVGVGRIFAETYACIPGETLMINVIAAEKTEILFLNATRLLEICPNSCAHHQKLIKNLLQISAQKNLELSRRILHTSSKTIRGRLLSYFSEQAMQNGSYQFTIPFNRQQLADYLGVDRSAMSNELSKMRNDGILSYEKNTFALRRTTIEENQTLPL